MLRFITNTFALIIAFTVGAAITCQIAFAATASDGSLAPDSNKHNAVRAKRAHPYHLYLPDTGISAIQQSAELNPAWFSGYQGKQTYDFVKDKELENGASLATPSLFLSQEARPTTALMIGWVPAKAGSNGPYQPGPYQYASTETKAGGCRTVDRTTSNAIETPDSGSKGLHLPAGWLLGMCLHY